MIEVDSQHYDSCVLRIRKAMEKLTPYNYHILEACYIHNNIVKALLILLEELGQEGNRNRL